jgi:hypothetical protein
MSNPALLPRLLMLGREVPKLALEVSKEMKGGWHGTVRAH